MTPGVSFRVPDGLGKCGMHTRTFLCTWLTLSSPTKMIRGVQIRLIGQRVWFCVLCLGYLILQKGAAAIELRGARLFKSGPIQISADGKWAWMVNPDNDSVSRLETATEAVTEFKLPAGEKHAPKGCSIKEDGSEVYVACHDSD